MGPITRRLFALESRTGWALFAIVGLFLVVVVPILNLVVPPDSPFHAGDFLVSILGKYLCFALLALALDLLWGYAGALSLGHGAFFAIGGYADAARAGGVRRRGPGLRGGAFRLPAG